MLKKTTMLTVIYLIFFFTIQYIAWANSMRGKEVDIKAVFLFNFSRFITWPEQAFTSVDSAFNICILGQSPFGDILDKLLQNETVGDRPVVLREFEQFKQTGKCHILYVDDSKKHDLDDIFAFVRDKPILTVSDIDKFVQKGGMIGFFKHNRKIRFYIAPQTIRKANLIANSNLLRVGEIMNH